METGFCEDGLNCSWAHGNDELRAMARRRRPPHHSRTTPLYKTKNQAVCKLGEQGTNKGACAYAELTNERFPQSYQGPQGPTRGTRNTHTVAYLSLRAQTACPISGITEHMWMPRSPAPATTRH